MGRVIPVTAYAPLGYVDEEEDVFIQNTVNEQYGKFYIILNALLEPLIGAGLSSVAPTPSATPYLQTPTNTFTPTATQPSPTPTNSATPSATLPPPSSTPLPTPMNPNDKEIGKAILDELFNDYSPNLPEMNIPSGGGPGGPLDSNLLD